CAKPSPANASVKDRDLMCGIPQVSRHTSTAPESPGMSAGVLKSGRCAAGSMGVEEAAMFRPVEIIACVATLNGRRLFARARLRAGSEVRCDNVRLPMDSVG